MNSFVLLSAGVDSVKVDSLDKEMVIQLLFKKAIEIISAT